ncbi:TRAP transporter small permease subunit [soil metagenome]
MRWLQRFEEGVIIFLMIAMTLITFLQVVARYVFNYSFVWALEITGVMFAWLIFTGMSYGVRVGAHIGVDAAVKALGPRGARVVGSIAGALCVGYACIVTWGGYQYVAKMHEVGILMQDIPVQQWIPRLILPVGFAVLAVRFAHLTWLIATGQRVSLVGDEAEEALKLKTEDAAAEVGR